MYKLLIVDDEIRIRTGLSNLIEWEVYGIEVSGLAEDGLKAYLHIKSESPDIVLVDISMPNMTGIELIELCSQLDSPPKFIILSGYDDFEYLRKAIQLGAIDYLLKPVDEDDLIHAVSSCLKVLEEEHTKQQQLLKSTQALQNDLLFRILHNQITSHELHERGKVIDISLHCISMHVGVIMLYTKNGQSLPAVSAAEICRNILFQRFQCYVVLDVNSNIAVIFKDPQQQFSDDEYLDAMTLCSEEITLQYKCQSYLALGREVNHTSKLSQSYIDCISKLEKKMILGDRVEDDLSNDTRPSVNYQQFIDTVETHDKESIHNILHDCCLSFLSYKQEEDINYIKYQLIDLLTYTLRTLYPNFYFSPELERKKQQAFTIINQTDSILELVEKLTVFFISLADTTSDVAEESEYPHIVQHVLSIVRTTYSDNSLSLKTIAGQLNVNPAYLGREFTLATGEYFNDFLNRTRIAKACHLLHTTSLKTAKIAEAVGFTNSSYFFTVFRKITGQSPRDYRGTVKQK